MRCYTLDQIAGLLDSSLRASLATQRDLQKCQSSPGCEDTVIQMTLTSVEIHSNIIQIQLSNRVVGTLQIRTICISAFRNSHVGDQVCQAVGFYRIG
jgi:hypothetical protein